MSFNKFVECLNTDPQYIVTIIAVIALIIFVYFVIDMDNCDKMCGITCTDPGSDTENFVVYANTKHKYCAECGTLGRKRCGECVDCGYCYTPNGTGECVPGDEDGPYFRADCVDYEYTTPSYINGIYYPGGYPRGYLGDGVYRNYRYYNGLNGYYHRYYDNASRKWRYKDKDGRIHDSPHGGHKNKDWVKHPRQHVGPKSTSSGFPIGSGSGHPKSKPFPGSRFKNVTTRSGIGGSSQSGKISGTSRSGGRIGDSSRSGRIGDSSRSGRIGGSSRSSGFSGSSRSSGFSGSSRSSGFSGSRSGGSRSSGFSGSRGGSRR